MTVMAFTCSICEEESTRICVNCTKDSCENHLCEKCQMCSDCCSCEVRLTDPTATTEAPAEIIEAQPEEAAPPVPNPLSET